MENGNKNQVGDISSLTMAEQDDPRENLIATAVNFLQNPSVQSSSLATKKAFLRKKGLRESEVELAVQRSGVAEHVSTDIGASDPGTPAYVGPQGHTGHVVQYSPHIVPVTSTWAKVRDFTAFTIVVGGLGVVAYRLYRDVVRPYLFGKPQKSVITQVLEVQTEMSSTLVKVQETLQAIQNTLRLQEEHIQELTIQSGAKKTEASLGRLQDSQLVTELKGEVSSIKGLLLNRRQFPPAPTTTPVLPSWQRSAVSPTVTTGNVGPSGDSVVANERKVEPVSDVPDNTGFTGQGMSSEEGGGGLITDSGLVIANKNNGIKYKSPFSAEEEENDELDPANQILAEQSSTQQEDLLSSPNRELRKENGILAEDDTTVNALS